MKHSNLWLASEEISAKKINDIGFVENSNPDYTNNQELVIAIVAKIMELVAKDPRAATIFTRVKGPKFIQCTSKKIYRTNAVVEATVIRTTNNDFGPVLRLLGMISYNISPHYVIRPKSLEKALENGGWDKLIRRYQVAVNKQRNIDIMNTDDKFFDTEVNFQLMVKNLKSITIKKFPTTIGRILAIKPTSDTKDLGKFILIVNNKDYAHATTKIDELLKHVYVEKHTLATTKLSHKRSGTYPEVNGGSPVDNTLNDTIVTLNAELVSHAKPPPTTAAATAYQVPSQRLSI